MTKCVKVDGNQELIKEAADLFFKLGYKPYPNTGVEFWIDQKAKYLVIGFFETFIDWNSGVEGYEVTLPELRSMVTPNQKEYLVKTDTGYVLQVLSDVVDGHDGIIEVPEGANKYIQSIKYPERFGFLRNGSFWDNKWIKHCDKRDDYIVLWQRESLNDKVASAEEYRKSFTHTPKATLDVINNMQNAFEKAQNAINVQNAMAKLFTYPQYLSGVAHGKEFIVKPNQNSGGADHGVEQAQTRELSECDLIDSGKLIIGGFGESFPVGLEHHKFIQPEGFSEGGFIPKQNHGAPVGLLHHGFSGFTQPEELPFVSDNAWNNQIGGDHYKKLAIQPMEYALQNKLDYAQANVVKYVTRHADKNGKQDLLKAIHNIELMIAHYYSDQE